MIDNATIARIWRGRTRRDLADVYEPYLRREGIPPLQEKALGVCFAKIVKKKQSS